MLDKKHYSTKGHELKLYTRRRLELNERTNEVYLPMNGLRKNFFSQRVVAHWSKLPESASCHGWDSEHVQERLPSVQRVGRMRVLSKKTAFVMQNFRTLRASGGGGDHFWRNPQKAQPWLILLIFSHSACRCVYAFFSERELVFMFAICRRPSVCRLSVTFVHPTQPIEIFGNFSAPFNTMVTWRHPCTILRRSSQGNPSVGGSNQRVVKKWSDFGPFRGYISETVQNRR